MLVDDGHVGLLESLLVILTENDKTFVKAVDFNQFFMIIDIK